MGQATLVEGQVAEGGRLLETLLKSDFDVTAACWIRSAPDEYWYLYIASKIVDQQGAASAYGKLYSVFRENPDSRIEMMEVKLIESQSPLAKEIVRMHRRYPARVPTRFGGASLGDVPVDEAYVYPSTKKG